MSDYKSVSINVKICKRTQSAIRLLISDDCSDYLVQLYYI